MNLKLDNSTEKDNFLDLRTVFSQDIEPPQFIFPGAQRGQVALLAAQGGAGKSFFALELANQVASGEQILPFSSDVSGKVVFLTCEESRKDLSFRQKSLFSAFPILAKKLNDLEKNLFVMPVFERKILNKYFPSDLFTADGVLNKEMELWFHKIAHGAVMLIIDPLVAFHQLDENSSSQMQRFCQFFSSLAIQEDVLILFLHHSNKQSIILENTDSQFAPRGSSAIIDAVRCAMSLSHLPKRKNKKTGKIENEDEYNQKVLLSWIKLNNHKAMGMIELMRNENGVLINEQ